MLDVAHLTVRHGSLTVLEDIGFELTTGQWLMVAGPNGAGKTTLINAISQGVPYSGDIYYLDQNVKRMRPSALAREIGVLSQTHQAGYAFTVGEVVSMGRYAHQKSRLTFTGRQGEEKVQKALEITGMTQFKHKSVLTLSGGELQRTFLAQVFAQDPNLILLDEPANHLDLKYQKQLFELLEEWIKQPGRAIISVVHDLGLARAYGTHALLLNRGRMAAYGSNRHVLNRENLQNVYGMDVYDWMRSLLSGWEV